MRTKNNHKINRFKRTVNAYYKKNKRDFPWRQTSDPYKILVSEIMLQQTQAPRVVAKYRQFIKRFPTSTSLAKASPRTVLKYWSGLGYNRRALLLQKTAQTINKNYAGIIPSDTERLKSLPAIGPYTAAAIGVFAFNQPRVLIETNVRTVFIHHFFPRSTQVTDAKILPLIEQTLDQPNPRRWYTALMDYGAMLKKTMPNPSRRSRHHTKQSTFAGSNRQLRGMILRALLKQKTMSQANLATACSPFDARQIKFALTQLLNEQLIKQRNGRYSL